MNSSNPLELRKWELGPVALLIAGLMFMETLDATVLPTAAPTIARQFGVASSQVGICVTAYLTSMLVLIPVSTWFLEKWGSRRVLFGAIIVFTVASVLCATSTNLTELTFMRILQGAGGAMMVPVGRFVVLRSTDKANIIRAIAYLTWPALFAPVIAPALSGFLITYASWPWIFLINVPLGAVALVIAFRILPHDDHGSAGRLDWRGFYGTTASLGCLVIGSAELGKPNSSLLISLSLFIASIVLGVPTIRHFLRTPAPLIGLSALRIHTFRSASSGGGIFRSALHTVPFLLPLLFQDKFGWSPGKTGSIVLLLFVGNIGFKPFTTPILKKFRFRSILIFTCLASAATVVGINALGPTSPNLVIAVILISSGCFRSLGATCYNTITFADIDQPLMREANILANIIGQLTQVFAVALAVISLKVGSQLFGSAAEFTFALWIVVALMVYAAGEAFLLPHHAGDSIR